MTSVTVKPQYAEIYEGEHFEGELKSLPMLHHGAWICELYVPEDRGAVVFRLGHLDKLLTDGVDLLDQACAAGWDRQVSGDAQAVTLWTARQRVWEMVHIAGQPPVEEHGKVSSEEPGQGEWKPLKTTSVGCPTRRKERCLWRNSNACCMIPAAPTSGPKADAVATSGGSSPGSLDMVALGRHTSVDGTAVAWCEMGSGPPLVLLHGIHDSHRSWRRMAPVLAQWFRVLMPDLPGHGLSARPDAPYTLTWYARIVGAWMQAIGVARAHICGHSLGGGIAQWMVLEQRRRIDRLALVCPGGLGREVGLGLKYAAFPFLGPRLTPTVVRYGFPLVRWMAPRTFGHMEREEAERVVQAFRVPGTDRAFRRSLESVINLRGQYVRTIDRAREIADLPPIALFWGEKDPILPVKHGRSAVAWSTGISLNTYARCGHFPQLEIPAILARDVRAFLCDPDRPVPHILTVQSNRV